jgi:hypothetical protein
VFFADEASSARSFVLAISLDHWNLSGLDAFCIESSLSSEFISQGPSVFPAHCVDRFCPPNAEAVSSAIETLPA